VGLICTRDLSDGYVRTRQRFPMQIDGEPWMQPPCTVRFVTQSHVFCLLT